MGNGEWEWEWEWEWEMGNGERGMRNRKFLRLLLIPN